jgi:hypothetical protein
MVGRRGHAGRYSRSGVCPMSGGVNSGGRQPLLERLPIEL